MRADPPPLAFRLPAGWTPVPVPPGREQDIDFAAVHSRGHESFTPNITVSLRLGEPGSLTQMADSSLALLADNERDVVLCRRDVLGTVSLPGLAQHLQFHTLTAGGWVRLAQHQVMLTLPNSRDPYLRFVCIATLTATTRSASAVAPDFRDTLASLRIE
ncbi:hypothetical protein ACFUMH_07480 [Cellulomonas sp. NPDC057328]|uniref:hypothetical protein n=1 Tax=Cellulomonas sp. NPDC057328 TaxID=3346101 RepID=UPI00363151C3